MIVFVLTHGASTERFECTCLSRLEQFTYQPKAAVMQEFLILTYFTLQVQHTSDSRLTLSS